MNFLIFTEATSDLPKDYVDKRDVVLLNMPCYVNEESAPSDPKVLYDLMRSGVLPTTSLLSADDLVKAFEPRLKEGEKILYIAFSSALSGTYDSGMKAKEILDATYPNSLFVIDSKCASLGQGMIVDYALDLRDAGESVEDVYEKLQKDLYQVCHYFTVDNLFHLYRGGRVSRTKAVLGTILQLKPILHVDEQGRLIPISNARGRKKAVKMLLDYMVEKCGDNAPKKVFISHGDCEEDALFLAELIKEKYNKDIDLINYIGTVIGTHSGPNTLALFFMTPKLR